MKKIILACLMFGFGFASEELVIYSHRHYDADQGIFKLFTQKTGITIKVLQAKANELATRLKTEGENSKADLFMTADAGNLEQIRAEGLFTPITSTTIEKLSPKEFRASDNTWFAFTKRARVIVVSRDRVPKGAIKTYEDLTNPKWKGKILVRSSSNVYNISLLSNMIAEEGVKKTKQWAQGVVKNFARTPKGSDRDQIRAVYGKEGDIAISNSYYLGLLFNSKNPEDIKAAQSVQIIFPDQKGRGTHINVSGIGVLKSSKNKDNAIKFIEFILSPEAQEILTNLNYEYPINSQVKPAPLLQSWGEFKADVPKTFEVYYKNAKEALKIFDQVGWR